MLRSYPLRVALFFAFAFGSVLAPTVSLFTALALSPFPYERLAVDDPAAPVTPEGLARTHFANAGWTTIKKPGVPVEAAIFGGWKDGTRVGLIVVSDPADADTALTRQMFRGSLDLRVRTHGVHLRKARGTDGDGEPIRLFGWTEGPRAYWLEAPDEEAMARLVERLPFVRAWESPPLVHRLFDDHLAAVLGGLLAYVLLLVPMWARAASWVGVVRPQAGTPPCLVDDLRERLLALGEGGSPLVVTADGPRVEVAWNLLDACWRGPMRVGRLLMTHRLQLRLDETHRTVRAQDEQGLVRRDGSAAGTVWRWRAMRGIVFVERSAGVQAGLRLEGGRLRLDQDHRFRFDLGELRGAVSETVTAAGWTYRPVMAFRPRWLFG